MLPVVGVNVIGATGTRSQRITKQVLLAIDLDEVSTEVNCFVVKDLIRPFILGVDWLTKYKVLLNFETNQITIAGHLLRGQLTNLHWANLPPDTERPSTFEYRPTSPRRVLSVNNISTKTVEDTTHDAGDKSTQAAISNTETLTCNQNKALQELLGHYDSVFSDKPGLCNRGECSLRVNDTSYFVQKSYPIPLAQRDRVEQHIQSLIQEGIIERSDSAYINPVVVVQKKDNSVRLCLDARGINRILEPDRDCPSIPEEILQKFEGAKFFYNY